MGSLPLYDGTFAQSYSVSILESTYRSIQHDYRQTFFVRAINPSYRYRIVLPEEFISITETDLWKFQQKSLIADTYSALNSN